MALVAVCGFHRSLGTGKSLSFVRRNMPIGPEQRIAIETMFKSVAPEQFDRWSYLFARPTDRWKKFSPIDAWPLESEYDSYPNQPIKELLTIPPLSHHINRKVIVVRCGHSTNPGLSLMLLKDVFPNGEWDYKTLFEGFVCVIPGKIAIASNHEGGVYVYGA